MKNVLLTAALLLSPIAASAADYRPPAELPVTMLGEWCYKDEVRKGFDMITTYHRVEKCELKDRLIIEENLITDQIDAACAIKSVKRQHHAYVIEENCAIPEDEPDIIYETFELRGSVLVRKRGWA